MTYLIQRARLFYLFFQYATNIRVSTDYCSIICLSWSYNNQVTPVCLLHIETRDKRVLPYVFNMVFPTSPFKESFSNVPIIYEWPLHSAHATCSINEWRQMTLSSNLIQITWQVLKFPDLQSFDSWTFMNFMDLH